MLKREDAEERLKHLYSEIKRHQDLYYKKARPEISDREYDALFDELIELEKQYPDLSLPYSPIKRVGSDLDNEFPEVDHPFPMLSLDKVYNQKELEEWINKTCKDSGNALSFVIEEKVDGSTIVLHYENGFLIRAVTRGDGYTGNDITENVRTIRDIPLKLSRPINAIFRGEIYIDIEDFNTLNLGVDNIYANPRNFAAGSLRRKKSYEVAKIPLKSFVYEGFFFDEGIDSHIEALHLLTLLGFKVGTDIGFFSPHFDESQYESIFSIHHEWVGGGFEKIADFISLKREGRENLGYEIDGLVVKVNENSVRGRLGHTSHHPRWAIAYKFESPQAVSVIDGIEPQVGRTGRVTPVARIRPVNISGSRVSNVTLHNQDFIWGMDIAVGDGVAVSRRGDVIPAVEEVIEKNREGNKTYTLPLSCPVCKTTLVQDGAHHFCPNINCPARIFGRISFFVSRGQMDIENLGSETVKRLLEYGLIHDIPDIYTFDVDLLMDKEGFGEKKVALIKEGIERSKKKPFSVVLSSLGLDEIGPNVVDLLLDNGFTSINKLLEAGSKKDTAIFESIQGVGPKIAEKLIRQLNDPVVIGMINRLKSAGLNFSIEEEREVEKLPQKFAGEIWCVTGSFDHFKPRDHAMEEVKKRGGRVASSVTSKTTHLLAGANPGSKLDKARKFKTKIVNEEEFLKRIGLK
jgi:DNA ligase (NAD+)